MLDWNIKYTYSKLIIHELMVANLFPKQTSSDNIATFFPALPPSTQIKVLFLYAFLNLDSSKGILIPFS